MTPSEGSDSLSKVITRRFKTQELLDNFKKYGGENKVIIHYYKNWKLKNPSFAVNDLKVDTRFSTHLPTQLTKFLRGANKMFHSGGYGKLKEKEAFKFLKSIIESKEIKSQVKFIPGDEITLGE